MELTKDTKTFLRTIILIGLFALPFVPLVVLNSTFFPYIVGKNWTFRIIVEVIFMLWAALAIADREYRPKITPTLVATSVFVFLIALADIFGENPFKSFFSNYERMDGWMMLIHAWAYLVVAQSVLNTEKLWLWLWRVALSVGLFISIQTLLQSFAGETGRLYSTLGNPIYLAGYALFNIFIATLLAISDKTTRQWRFAYLATIPFSLYALYLTSTRGATLGLLLGAIVSLLGLAFTYRKNKKVLIVSLLTIAIFVMTAFGFWAMKDSDTVQKNPLLKRFASISLSDPSISARTMIWGMAIQGVKERPLLGWGQGGFNYVFNSHYNPNMFHLETWYDRAHNAVFDWLIAGGVFGFLAYLSIFLTLLWMIHKDQFFSPVQKWILYGLITAYAFQNLTVFDQVISYWLFFSLIAWVGAMNAGRYKTLALKIKERDISDIVALTVLAVSVVVAVLINYASIHTNRLLMRALIANARSFNISSRSVELAQKENARALELFKKAGEKRTNGSQEVHEQFAQIAGRLVKAKWLSNETKTQWYKAAYEGMKEEEKNAPKDGRPYVLESVLHRAYGNLKDEEKALLVAHKLMPTRQTVLVQMADNATLQGKKDLAMQYVQRAYELEPSIKEVAVAYIIIAYSTGNVDKANTLVNDHPELKSDPRFVQLLKQLKTQKK